MDEGLDPLRRHLTGLERRAIAASELVVESERALEQREYLEQLDAIVRKTRGFGLVTDERSSPWLRPARVWVAVGPNGIPDQTKALGETNAPFFDFVVATERVPIAPDLERYRGEGWTVMTRGEFVVLAEDLKKQVESGGRPFPYRPPTGASSSVE